MGQSSMICKTLEIRDKGTHIAALAIKMMADNPAQAYYIHERSGYPRDGSSIMLMCLYGGKATNDPYGWADLRMGPRTMPTAHNFIIDHFAELTDGQVIDVEYILGETNQPKVTERP